jgi:nicotinamidase-related amidase
MSRLERGKAALVVIDAQERLARVIHEYEKLERNIERLVRGCHVLGVPALVTEQYPKGLGPTTPALKRAIEETHAVRPIEKTCFSSLGSEEFEARMQGLCRSQVLVAGVEAHVCVYQTVRDLLGSGYEVTVVADAVSSRSPENRELALRRMADDGAHIASTEMVLFEMTAEAGTEEFRRISALVR